VVYLVRDPRDVAVSLAHHNSTTIDDAIKHMNAANGVICAWRKGLAPQLRQKLTSWSGHAASWLDQTDVPVHTVRYEDMVAAPAERFGAALEFAGRSATPAEINLPYAMPTSPSCNVRRERKVSRNACRSRHNSSAAAKSEAGGRR
jgi:aryl sulfotransferase